MNTWLELRFAGARRVNPRDAWRLGTTEQRALAEEAFGSSAATAAPATVASTTTDWPCCLTFELRGRRRNGAWPARRSIGQQCLAGQVPCRWRSRSSEGLGSAERPGWWLRQRGAALGLEGSLCRGREFEELARWPDWTADEFSSAVGTSAVQFGGGALGAERALKRADSRFE
jgi:hypothetical protein